MGQSGTNVIPHDLVVVLISSGAPALNSWGSARLFFFFFFFPLRTRRKMGTEGENCPALICCKNSDRRSFQRRSGRSKARLAESGREGRWYRRALISFTDECEMTSSVVWTHTRHHYTLLNPDPPLALSLAPAQWQLQAKNHCSFGPNNTSIRCCFVFPLATLSDFSCKS